MNSHTDCISCVVSKANSLADKYLTDKNQKHNFMKKVLNEIIEIDYERTAPYLVAKVMRLLKDEIKVDDIYYEEKQFFTTKLLEMETEIAKTVENYEDKILNGLKIALAGNIIDFGVFDNIDFEFVQTIIDDAFDVNFDEKTISNFKLSLEKSKKLLYIGDNTGEIVFDKIFIKKIKEKYPDLKIYFAVRGKPILNDSTIEDALMVGMDKHAQIISNGSDLPGTDLIEVSDEFKKIFKEADLILSKGQGNFESLPGCSHNVYYLLLCKCDLLTKQLNCDKFSPVFLHEDDASKVF